jgi:hypothetical protein
MSASATSTLYPKITNHISEIIKALREIHSEDGQQEVALGPIPIVGTVKLHGTHADILIYSDDRIDFQSRNVAKLVNLNDNQGFVAAMAVRTSAILRLRDGFIARWTTLNPGVSLDLSLDLSLPVLIAGEWVGSKIQKGVAISQLSRRFAIISANINGSWVADSQYADIEDPDNNMYNISRGGIFHSVLYPDEIQRTISELEVFADNIAARCPFAASFDVHGEGEGLVWKLAPPQYNSNSTLWFKTKGGRFKPTFASAPRKLAAGAQEMRDAAAIVAGIWCTELRLEQGWSYLEETGCAQNMKSLSTFLKWVQQDIAIEERGYILEHGIDEGMLRIEIAKIAKIWYIGRLSRGDV